MPDIIAVDVIQAVDGTDYSAHIRDGVPQGTPAGDGYRPPELANGTGNNLPPVFVGPYDRRPLRGLRHIRAACL
jgi:hypothetical protein